MEFDGYTVGLGYLSLSWFSLEIKHIFIGIHLGLFVYTFIK